AVDSAAKGNTGTLVGGNSWVSGAINGANSFDGSTGYMYSAAALTAPVSFTTTLWFKTSAASGPGGLLIGFGDSPTGGSAKYDRHTFMNDSGQIYFGVWTTAAQLINTTNAYNDGKWHFVAGSLASDGLKLYVDGSLVASNASVTSGQIPYPGYWRIGNDTLTG